MVSSRAPSNVEDNCPLGDRPGIFDSTGKTCAQLVSSDPGVCYGSYTEANCCESCNNARTDNSGTCVFILFHVTNHSA